MLPVAPRACWLYQCGGFRCCAVYYCNWHNTDVVVSSNLYELSCRMTDYMLANALQQALLHALADLLELLTGCPWLDQADLQSQSQPPTPVLLSAPSSLQAGQPLPVVSWQTGPSGAQPLSLMSPTTGLPVAQPQQSLQPARTASIGANLRPWIDMALLLNSTQDDLLFRPPVSDFVHHFDNMLRDLPNTIAVVQRLVTHPDLEVTLPCVWPPFDMLTVSPNQAFSVFLEP